MLDETLHDLPKGVREVVDRILEAFVESGSRGLVEKGLCPLEALAVMEERCADFGSHFRIPPDDAPVYVFQRGDVYKVELPLWLEGQDERSDLFIFMEIDPVAGTASVTDLYVP